MSAFRGTTAVSASVAGMVLARWTAVDIIRDLSEISGSFILTLRDDIRSRASWPYGTPGEIGPMLLSQRVEISIHGELYLVGWAEDVIPDASEGEAILTISGRDLTGDLADCAAGPEGPVEFANVTLEDLAGQLCAPFGISVRADVDTGAPFEKATIDAAETVLSAIEKHARQRGVLVTSDGVEGLLLTRSGQTRAPSDIRFPGPGVKRSSARFSTRDRFSDYFVKGQTEKAGGKRAKAAPLTPATTPQERVRRYLAGDPASSEGGSKEAAGVAILGHARDREISRWRPHVAMMKSKGSADGAQKQAEWMERVHRARGEEPSHELHPWRWQGGLWRPNALVHVSDSFLRVDRDFLIAGVDLVFDEDNGETASLRLVGPEAYDPEEDAE
ncbi:MAG: Mu P family protein [Salinarimonadaceae bacterium]|nr:MAG: Mu P family protein [Salinarimonadaceae bacterium]